MSKITLFGRQVMGFRNPVAGRKLFEVKPAVWVWEGILCLKIPESSSRILCSPLRTWLFWFFKVWSNGRTQNLRGKLKIYLPFDSNMRGVHYVKKKYIYFWVTSVNLVHFQISILNITRLGLNKNYVLTWLYFRSCVPYFWSLIKLLSMDIS